MITKKRLWEIIAKSHKNDTTSKIFDSFILTLIILNIIAVIIGTIQPIEERYSTFLNAFEIFSITIFTVEYLLRVWLCSQDYKYSNGIKGKLKFIFTPLALIDFIAIAPFYIPFFSFDLRFIRIFRLFRIIRILKLGRYFTALKIIKKVFKQKKEELIVISGFFTMSVIISSVLIYYAEHAVQPAKFPNILPAFWWSITTLTTVGSSIYPITSLGQILNSIVSIFGVLLIAIPTGVITIGFVEVYDLKNKNKKCPHCGKEI